MPKNFDFGFKTETMIRLAHVEAILRATRVMIPVPSRDALIKLIEDGTLIGRKTRYGYLVTEQSFKDFVKSLQPDAYQMIK
jgi:hypothetical protein